MNTIHEKSSEVSYQDSISSENNSNDNPLNLSDSHNSLNLSQISVSINHSYGDIQNIIKSSEILNQQVRLRLEKLISRLNFSNQSYSEKVEKLAKSLSDISNPTSTLRINQDYLNQINAHQEILLKLFEQVEVLSKEIELEKGLIMSQSCLLERSDERQPCCCRIV